MGDVNRISKTFEDPSFLKLMRDMDTLKVTHDLKPAFIRPAYAYTKAEVGGHEEWLIGHMKS